MREEFEEWVSSKNLETSFGNYVDDEYDATWTQVYWESWQASREALVVELPVTVCRTHVFEIPYTHEVGMEHDEYFEVDDIQKALDAAGVAYK